MVRVIFLMLRTALRRLTSIRVVAMMPRKNQCLATLRRSVEQRFCEASLIDSSFYLVLRRFDGVAARRHPGRLELRLEIRDRRRQLLLDLLGQLALLADGVADIRLAF